MPINSKKILGATPDKYGEMDAVHCPIIAVKAGGGITRGSYIRLEKGLAIQSSEPQLMVADPFAKGRIAPNQVFWAIADPQRVTEVRHTWTLKGYIPPELWDGSPEPEVPKCKVWQETADALGMDYDYLLECFHKFANNEGSQPYRGTLEDDEALEAAFEKKPIWGSWYELWEIYCDMMCLESNEVGEDYGTACCPEIEWPHAEFYFPVKHEDEDNG